MAKPKVKLDFKDLLMRKGEYAAIAVAGILMVVFLAWGVGSSGNAVSGEKVFTEVNNGAQGVTRKAAEKGDEGGAAAAGSKTDKVLGYPTVPANTFTVAGTLFDPTGRPEAKRDNPFVLPLEEYQVDLIRGPMRAYDIIYTPRGDAMIAVKVPKDKKADFDVGKMRAAIKVINTRGRQGANAYVNYHKRTPQQGGPPGPGGPPPGMGPGGPPPGMGPGGPPPGMGGPPPGTGSSMSGAQIGFGGDRSSDANTQRTANDDTQIVYIPLDSLDKAMREEKKTPAMTIVPLRLVVIHASFPLALQREEIRRALRMMDVAQVTASGQPEFAGFKVRRRVIDTDGTVLGTNPPKKITDLKPEDSIVKDGRTNDGWAEYDYKDKYIELIHARKMSDHFDVVPDRPETGYLPSFLRYEEGMAMPLPDLVGDVSIYPSLKLKLINAQIKKWEAMRRPKQDASDMVNRLRGKNRDGVNPFIPQTAQDSAASTFFGDQKFRGPDGMTSGIPPGLPPGAPSPPGIGPKVGGPPPGMGIPGMPPPGTPGIPGLPGTEAGGVIDPEHLLLRFLDCDVQPGLTYQYQIQVVMKNPNYRAKSDPEYKTQAAMMAKPDMVDQQFIQGAWTQIGEAITIPSEAFLYAIDRDEYHKKLVDEFSPKSEPGQPGQPSTTAKEKKEYQDIMRRLDVKDDQVVIEVQQWREEVRTESGGAREPVGKWVVADMPVRRGEFIGKKTFVKLPLWSSKDTAYTFREMPAKVFKGDKQPDGWLVDFSSRWLLVDFEGGKSKTRLLNGRTISEDAAADLLVVRPDGSLVVLNSAQGTDDPGRQDRLKKWEDWLKEAKKPGESKKDDFARPPGMN